LGRRGIVVDEIRRENLVERIEIAAHDGFAKAFLESDDGRF